MMTLIIGLLIFFSVHLISTNLELRAGLTSRFGERGYKIGYSLVSLIGFAVLVYGYHKTQLYVGSKNPVLWDPPTWTAHIAHILMLPAMILLVASKVPSKISAAVGHPMLVAIKIWALAHLLATGTAAALVLFSSFLAYAVYSRISIKWRGAQPPAADANAGITNDLIVVALGAALYAFMLLWGHEHLIGKALIG